MKPEKIIEAMNMIDDDLIEQAERKNKVKNIHFTPAVKRLIACAACAIFIIATSYAAEIVEAFKSYFVSQNDVFPPEVMTDVVTDENEDLIIRLDGAVADRHSCHMIVSFISKKPRLFNGYEQEGFALYAIDKNGGRVDFDDRSSGTYMEHSPVAKAITKITDADATYLVSGTFEIPQMENMDKLVFECEGLRLETEIENNILPEYPLYTADGAETGYVMTPIGLYVNYKTDTPDEHIFNKVFLLDKGGKAVEMGFSGHSSTAKLADGSEHIVAIHTWSKGHIDVHILDMDNYIGVRIGDTDYYFVRKN